MIMYCLFTKCTHLNVVRSHFSRKISFRSSPTCKKFTTMSKKVHKSNSYISINLENNVKNPSVRKQSTGSIKSGTQDSRKSEFIRLFSLAKPEKWKLSGAVCLLFISSAVSMSVPFALGKVLDIIYTNSENADMAKEKLNHLCLVLIGVFVVGALCNLGRVYIMSTAGYRMTQKLRMNVFSSVLKQEQAFFDTRSTGELVNRISADTQIVGQALSSNISDGLRSTVMVLAGSGMMIYMSYELALVGLAIVPPVALLAVVYGRFTRKISRKVQDSLADATKIAEERISNIRTVRSFAQEEKEVELYRTKIERVLKMGYTESKARAVFFGMTGFSGNVIIISVLYYGGVMVSSHTITVGHLSSFLLYAAYIGVSVGGLSSFYTELNRSVGAAKRLWEIIDKDVLIPNQGGIIPSVLPKGHIEFKNINFSYPSRCDTQIFKDLNLEIAPGSTVAVVGPSGSGKSTLAALLLRLYDPNSGEVYLDGVDVRTLDASWLRKNIGTVSQEPILFSCTIKENILYGAENPDEITDEELERVVTEANVKEFVHKLEAGYDTLVGERGVMLSGGQKQRVAIARALIKNPRILLLDEATSALDAQSEHLVREALERIMKRRTVLTIAHRLSTIQNADIIAVLANGVIVEQGKYNDLINLPQGHFKELIKHQTFKEVNPPDELQSIGVL